MRAIGKDAAIVLAEIDFLDRAQELPGRPVASRARILADLEGLVGRNSVDNALRILVEAGWLKRHERRTLGPFNIQRSYDFSLEADVIAASLSEQAPLCALESSGIPVSELRESRKRDRSRNRNRELLDKKEVDVEAAAVGNQPTNGNSNTDPLFSTGKRRRKRNSGIVTWDTNDEQEAMRIEEMFAQKEITEALAIIGAAGKEAVPGIVCVELERQVEQRRVAPLRAAAEANHQARLNEKPAGDPRVFSAGLAYLSASKRRTLIARKQD